ncbi:MAG: hypothetical protein SNJ67_12950, partial [Chloracidobacterium sp.]
GVLDRGGRSARRGHPRQAGGAFTQSHQPPGQPLRPADFVSVFTLFSWSFLVSLCTNPTKPTLL